MNTARYLFAHKWKTILLPNFPRSYLRMYNLNVRAIRFRLLDKADYIGIFVASVAEHSENIGIEPPRKMEKHRRILAARKRYIDFILTSHAVDESLNRAERVVYLLLQRPRLTLAKF